jgi:hypothetical protein
MIQSNQPRAAGYARERGRLADAPYEQKFADLIALCQQGKAGDFQIVIVAAPWVLGDTYEEIVESLSRIAEAGMQLVVTKR